MTTSLFFPTLYCQNDGLNVVLLDWNLYMYNIHSPNPRVRALVVGEKVVNVHNCGYKGGFTDHGPGEIPTNRTYPVWSMVIVLDVSSKHGALIWSK